MINFGSYILVAIALSMDAFSIAITLGISSFSRIKKALYVILVGSLHFILPFLGLQVGKSAISKIISSGEKLLGLVLFLLALEMIYEYFHEKDTIQTSYMGIILLAITVSLDSFMTGLGLFHAADLLKILLTFSLTSAFFSFIGIVLGKSLERTIGQKSNLIGILILLALGVKFFLF